MTEGQAVQVKQEDVTTATEEILVEYRSLERDKGRTIGFAGENG